MDNTMLFEMKGIEKIFGRAKTLGMEKICAFVVEQVAVLFDLDNKYAVSLADDIGAKVMLSLCGEFSLGVYLEELCSVEILVIDSLNAKRRTDITPGDVPTNLKLCSILSEMINAKYYVLRCPDGSCFVYNGKYYYVVPTYDIETLDATASIESFNASLLLKYLSTKDIKAACEFAVLCEVITCQKLGGPGSLPTFKQIKDFVSENQLDERLIK